jgi:hypothetical protein
MASWAEPHDWIAGDLAATASANGTVDMNQQVYGNMLWLGTTHDHAGGTRGNNQVGPVSYVAFIDKGAAAVATATAQRLYYVGTAFKYNAGATGTYILTNSTHTH